MKPIRPLLFAVLCACSFGAAAQWQWLDRDGRKVFSDRPPPLEIPEKDVLRRPAGAARAAGATAPAPNAPAAVAANTPRAAASLPRPSGVDKELEEKKKQAEDAEAAKKKAEEQRVAALRADNCNRARQAKATFDSGMRVATTNAQGERIVLDDAARAAEARRLQDIIASDCR